MQRLCLEGTTERSYSNRVRSARKGEARTTCLAGTTPQDMPQSSALIEFVKIRATEQVAIFEAHCIRVNSCNSWAKKSVGQNYSVGFSSAKLSPRTPHFQQKHPKTTPVFFSLKVVLLSKKVVSSSLISIAPRPRFDRPSPKTRSPHGRDATAPRP